MFLYGYDALYVQNTLYYDIIRLFHVVIPLFQTIIPSFHAGSCLLGKGEKVIISTYKIRET